jgi:hypothetical protein
MALTTSEAARPRARSCPGIEIDLHLALLAAVGIGDRGARDRRELRAQDVVAEIEYLLLGDGLARQCELQDGDARGVVGQNERRRRARRRGLQLGLRDGDDLRHRQVLSAFGWKKYLTTAVPLTDCDSVCSTSFTTVCAVRSENSTMRSAISSGRSPV